MTTPASSQAPKREVAKIVREYMARYNNMIATLGDENVEKEVDLRAEMAQTLIDTLEDGQIARMTAAFRAKTSTHPEAIVDVRQLSGPELLQKGLAEYAGVSKDDLDDVEEILDHSAEAHQMRAEEHQYRAEAQQYRAEAQKCRAASRFLKAEVLLIKSEKRRRQEQREKRKEVPRKRDREEEEGSETKRQRRADEKKAEDVEIAQPSA